MYNSNPNNAQLSQDVQRLIDLVSRGSIFIIGGDFNSKHENWNNLNNNYNGEILNSWLQSQIGITKQVYPIFPTYRAGNRFSSIDFFLSSEIIRIKSPNIYEATLIEFESDHKAVQIIIDLLEKVGRKPSRKVRDYANANWIGFHLKAKFLLYNLDLPTNRSLNINEIDQLNEQITESISKAEKENIPTTNITSNDYLALPDLVVHLIKYKNRLRRSFFRNPLAINAQSLKSQINLLNILIKTQIQIARDESFKSKLRNLKKDIDVFKNINKITGRKPFPSLPNLVTSGITPQVITDSLSKLDCIGKHFEKIHGLNVGMGDPQRTLQINNYIQSIFQINSSELLSLISKFTEQNTSDGNNYKESVILKLLLIRKKFQI